MNQESFSVAVAESDMSLAPNIEILRAHGWVVFNLDGPYCSAWKGTQEVLLLWRDGRWFKMLGNSGVSA